MQRFQKLRNRLVTLPVLAAMLLAAAPRPAHAASKEIIELQTEMMQLLDMVQRLQSTIDNRLGVVQHLAEQTADNANRMSEAVTALQQKLATQNDAVSAKLDTTSGQMQSINDSVDELKSRIAKLDKTIQDMQTQLQAIQSAVPAQPAPGTAPATTATPGTPAAMGNAQAPAANSPAGMIPSTAAGQAPPIQETFQAGERDFSAAKYDVAAGEFMDVIRYYPMDDLAGSAHFYLGEIAYRHQTYTDAVKSYNTVLEGFSGCSHAPTAQLHKGYSLLQMNKREAGIHELRLLIQRHPQTPEAAQARNKLNAIGARIVGN